jgi:fatty acid desaturase
MMNSISEPAMDHSATGSQTFADPRNNPAKESVVTTESTETKAPKERSYAEYRQILSSSLAPEVFKANPARLGWYFSCMAIGIASFVAVVLLNPAWELKLVAGIVIGLCNGTLGFVCHELGHGSIVKNRKVQNFLGYFGMIPFLVSPTYWKFSHNRLHHANAQRLIEDPDAFPNLRIYRASKFMRFMFPFTPGSGYKRSAFYFFYWFSFHNIISQLYLRFRNRIFDGMDHKQVSLELGGQIAIVIGLAIFAGPSNWFFLLLIPLAVQNYMLMSYISTNHNLSPLTSENDPLVNSLSVTNHPVLEFLHLNFGYHVEHHLYPTVNPKHAKAIHYQLVKQFPDLYKIMPKHVAMKKLYKTARIYKNSRQLVHPETMEVFDTV